MRNHQGFGNSGFAVDATDAAQVASSISRIFKWVVGLIVACLFMASAVCRAHDGHEHTTDPVITDPAPTPAPFIGEGQGRLYNDIEMMGIYGTALAPDTNTGGGDPDFVPADNPFLTTTGECQVPTVPLPAAVWAGVAGGAMVLGRGRRARSRW